MAIWPNCCCSWLPAARFTNCSGVAAGKGLRQVESAATETAARPGAPARLAFALAECPIRVEAPEVPKNFLDGFRDRDCASLDCPACGYCERIAAQAVSISPEYRTEVLRKYAEMDAAIATGGLWVFERAPRRRSSWTGRTVIWRWPPQATASWRASIATSAAPRSSGVFSLPNCRGATRVTPCASSTSARKVEHPVGGQPVGARARHPPALHLPGDGEPHH